MLQHYITRHTYTSIFFPLYFIFTNYMCFSHHRTLAWLFLQTKKLLSLQIHHESHARQLPAIHYCQENRIVFPTS